MSPARSDRRAGLVHPDEFEAAARHAVEPDVRRTDDLLEPLAQDVGGEVDPSLAGHPPGQLREVHDRRRRRPSVRRARATASATCGTRGREPRMALRGAVGGDGRLAASRSRARRARPAPALRPLSRAAADSSVKPDAARPRPSSAASRVCSVLPAPRPRRAPRRDRPARARPRPPTRPSSKPCAAASAAARSRAAARRRRRRPTPTARRVGELAGRAASACSQRRRSATEACGPADADEFGVEGGELALRRGELGARDGRRFVGSGAVVRQPITLDLESSSAPRSAQLAQPHARRASQFSTASSARCE